MIVKSIEPISAEQIVMDNNQTYRRYPSGLWEIFVKDDYDGYWDMCTEDEEEFLESVYKKRDNGDSESE